MTLTKVTGQDVERDLYTSYDPDPATVCGIHRGRGVPLAVLLVPVLLLLRRRRR